MLNRKRYMRPVSATERYNLVFNELNPFNVNFVVEGEGKLELQQWQNAVAQAAEANPGCRVRLKGMLGFSRWVDSGITPTVSELDTSAWSGYSSANAMFLQNKFEPLNGGPIFDILISNGNPARLVFRGCHCAFDGRGIIHLASEIFRAMRGEPLLGALSPLTDANVRDAHRKHIPTSLPPMPNVIPILPSEDPDQIETDKTAHYIWRRSSVPKKIPKILPKSLLFLANHAQQFSRGSTAFTIPIDFRGLRTEALSTGNLTGFLNVRVAEDDTSKAVMLNIHKSIRSYHDCYIGTNTRKILWTPLNQLVEKLRQKSSHQLYTANNKVMSAGVVSLGYFDSKQWSCEQFKAITGFGIPGAVGRLNVFLLNTDTCTEILVSAPHTFNHQGQLDEMLARMTSSL